MKEITIQLYTIDELEHINKNAFNKIINNYLEEVREITNMDFQNDFREFRENFTKITEININYDRNGYPALFYDDNWTEDIKGIRFFGKLQKILKQLKESEYGQDYIMREFINNIKGHISRIPKYLIENYTLLEYLSKQLNELYNNLSFEAWDVSTEYVQEFISNNYYDSLFTKNGEKIYIE